MGLLSKICLWACLNMSCIFLIGRLREVSMLTGENMVKIKDLSNEVFFLNV